MNNTDKLLRAFIEAQGYEIKEIHTRPIDPIMRDMGFDPIPDDYKVTKKPVEHWDYCSADPVFSRAQRITFLQNEINRLLREDESNT